MNVETLLDAIGMIDDSLLVEEDRPVPRTFRRRTMALIAAIITLLLATVTAMAVSEDFREIVFSIFNIQTHEAPPVTQPGQEGTTAAETSPSGLREMGIVSIDDEVNAYYFAHDGYVISLEGGFYTYHREDQNAAPEDPAFWEITPEGIQQVEAIRVEFPLDYGGRTFDILIDYAVMGGKLYETEWPKNVDQDPIGNGWIVETIPGRTDAVMLTIAVLENIQGIDFYSQHPLLLDLNTLEVTDLLAGLPLESFVVDYPYFNNDLSYVLLMGSNEALEENKFGYWLCDLEQGTVTRLDDIAMAYATTPYFLDSETLVYEKSLGDGQINLVRYHIPTGTRNTILENAKRRSYGSDGYSPIDYWGRGGHHGLLYREDGSIDLVDLHTWEMLNLTGLERDALYTIESPGGTRVLMAYRAESEDGAGYYSQVGVLNPETGILKMLSREPVGREEYSIGWLDENTVVVRASEEDAPSGRYVYVYRFED